MNLKCLVKDFHIYAFFFLSALGKDSGVRNLLNTRPDLEGVEKLQSFGKLILLFSFSVSQTEADFFFALFYLRRG